MQNIKPSDITKLEEFGISLAANSEPVTNPNPVETAKSEPSAPLSEAENSVRNIIPL